MGFKGLTINTDGGDEAHIYAEDHAAMFRCIFGNEDMIFPYGELFKTVITGSNSIRVSSGLLCVQGHLGTIPYNDTQSFILQNGSPGATRKDLLVATFETSGLHGIDTFKLEVLTGTTNCTKGNLDAGDLKTQFPLAEITIEGLAASSVRMLNEPIMNMSDLKEYLTNKITYGVAEPLDSFGRDGDIYIKYEG